MIAFDPFQFIAIAFVTCGLAAVVWEIAVKAPGAFREMMTDSRGFAERPVSGAPQPESSGAQPSASRGSGRPGQAA
ncbi:MAG TPA: hypothetical protein VIR45_04700 [Kiloniellaceae bacterium]